MEEESAPPGLPPQWFSTSLFCTVPLPDWKGNAQLAKAVWIFAPNHPPPSARQQEGEKVRVCQQKRKDKAETDVLERDASAATC